MHPTPRRAVNLGQTVDVPLASMFVSHGLPPPPVLPLPWSLKINNGNAPGEDGQHRKGPAQGDRGVTAEVSRGSPGSVSGCGGVRPGGQWGSWTVSSCRSHSSVRLWRGWCPCGVWPVRKTCRLTCRGHPSVRGCLLPVWPGGSPGGSLGTQRPETRGTEHFPCCGGRYPHLLTEPDSPPQKAPGRPSTSTLPRGLLPFPLGRAPPLVLPRESHSLGGALLPLWKLRMGVGGGGEGQLNGSARDLVPGRGWGAGGAPAQSGAKG